MKCPECGADVESSQQRYQGHAFVKVGEIKSAVPSYRRNAQWGHSWLENRNFATH